MARLLSPRLLYRVGGERFLLESYETPISLDVPACYGPFVEAAPEAGEGGAIRVGIEVGPLEPPTGEPIFDAGSWRVLRHDGERSVVFQTVLMSEPLYEARFRPGAREVRLSCSPGTVTERDGSRAVDCHFRYPLDQVLTMYELGSRGLIVHSAGVIAGGRGLVLAGVSGAGKSTVTRLAADRPGFVAVSDDRVILRTDGPDGAAMHGTPWHGEEAVARSESAPLHGLLFLEKGDRNEVRPISRREALARLLPTVSLPWYDPEARDAGLAACDAVVRGVPAGVFTFRPEPGAVEALEAFLDRGAVGVASGPSQTYIPTCGGAP